MKKRTLFSSDFIDTLLFFSSLQLFDVEQLSISPCENFEIFCQLDTQSSVDLLSTIGTVTGGYLMESPIIDDNQVTWKAPLHQIKSLPIKEYILQRSTTGIDFETLYHGEQTQFKVTHPNPNTTYNFR